MWCGVVYQYYYDVINVLLSMLVIRAKLAYWLSRSLPTCQSILYLSSSALIHSVSIYETFKLNSRICHDIIYITYIIYINYKLIYY